MSRNTICDEDCFHCKFPDCRLPASMCCSPKTLLTEAQKRERKLAYYRQYKESHKEHIRQYQAAYRAKRREERCQKADVS